jgi:transcriptional regulator with XRE-family HTH domain
MVTFLVKPESATRLRAFGYVRRMDDAWRNLSEPWERMSWARRRAGFSRASAAAEALGIAEHTYRTWERATENGGRWPTNLALLQSVGKKFGVSWVWLATGAGAPIADPQTTEATEAMSATIHRLPAAKRPDAIRAALAVLESYAKEAS